MRLSLIALLLVVAFRCAAQEPAQSLSLWVNVRANGADRDQFTVTLFKDNEKVADLPPSKFGAFQLDLDLNAHFSVRVEKPGYRGKTIAVDTHAPEGFDPEGPMAYTVDLEPLGRFTHADPFYLDFPCALINWNAEEGLFDHSERYLADIQLKMALLAAQAPVE